MDFKAVEAAIAAQVAAIDVNSLPKVPGQVVVPVFVTGFNTVYTVKVEAKLAWSATLTAEGADGLTKEVPVCRLHTSDMFDAEEVVSGIKNLAKCLFPDLVEEEKEMYESRDKPAKKKKATE